MVGGNLLSSIVKAKTVSSSYFLARDMWDIVLLVIYFHEKKKKHERAEQNKKYWAGDQGNTGKMTKVKIMFVLQWGQSEQTRQTVKITKSKVTEKDQIMQ